jgi:hypothetical protein
MTFWRLGIVFILFNFFAPASEAAASRLHFLINLGVQYTAYPSALLNAVEADRRATTLIPIRAEIGSYFSVTERFLTGFVYRTEIESNFIPFDSRGVLTYAYGGVNVSVRYLFPIVLGEQLSGAYLRADLGFAGMTHPTAAGLTFGLDTLLGAGYSISILEDKGAVLLEIGYAPRFVGNALSHSLGLTVGLML